jgi:hypothetical protein
MLPPGLHCPLLGWGLVRRRKHIENYSFSKFLPVGQLATSLFGSLASWQDYVERLVGKGIWFRQPYLTKTIQIPTPSKFEKHVFLGMFSNFEGVALF